MHLPSFNFVTFAALALACQSSVFASITSAATSAQKLQACGCIAECNLTVPSATVLACGGAMPFVYTETFPVSNTTFDRGFAVTPTVLTSGLFISSADYTESFECEASFADVFATINASEPLAAVVLTQVNSTTCFFAYTSAYPAIADADVEDAEVYVFLRNAYALSGAHDAVLQARRIARVKSFTTDGVGNFSLVFEANSCANRPAFSEWLATITVTNTTYLACSASGITASLRGGAASGDATYDFSAPNCSIGTDFTIAFDEANDYVVYPARTGAARQTSGPGYDVALVWGLSFGVGSFLTMVAVLAVLHASGVIGVARKSRDRDPQNRIPPSFLSTSTSNPNFARNINNNNNGSSTNNNVQPSKNPSLRMRGSGSSGKS